MQKRIVILVLAILLLGVGIGSGVYLGLSGRIKTKKTETIIIAGKELPVKPLFETWELRSVEDYKGIALDALVKEVEVKNPEVCSYTIIAADGYQKTIAWKDFQQGLLTRERRTVFPSLPKQFWVRDVVRIEVIE